MLYTKTVLPHTLSLLKELINIPELHDFSLVGGTALSLLFGHRTSKVDFVRHPHKLIGEVQIHDNIRMFSLKDLIATKVQAVLGRGRKKDFWDIAELLNHFSVSDFVQFHEQKYSDQNLMITVPQAITYFADAEEDEDPVSLKGQTWISVKKNIQTKVSEYLK